MITSIEQLKELIIFMRDSGVDKFSVDNVSVEFTLNAASRAVEVIPGDTPSEQLSNIKSTLQKLKDEADADELWSV